MGIKILHLRHKVTPQADGCRWCGFPKHVHPACTGKYYGWCNPEARHCYEMPTTAQRAARLAAPLVFSMPGGVANDDRTRL